MIMEIRCRKEIAMHIGKQEATKVVLSNLNKLSHAQFSRQSYGLEKALSKVGNQLSGLRSVTLL